MKKNNRNLPWEAERGSLDLRRSDGMKNLLQENALFCGILNVQHVSSAHHSTKLEEICNIS